MGRQGILHIAGEYTEQATAIPILAEGPRIDEINHQSNVAT
jgi:hypothetical protein